MTSIGNQLANSIWEANTKGLPKPKPTSPRSVSVLVFSYYKNLVNFASAE